SNVFMPERGTLDSLIKTPHGEKSQQLFLCGPKAIAAPVDGAGKEGENQGGYEADAPPHHAVSHPRYQSNGERSIEQGRVPNSRVVFSEKGCRDGNRVRKQFISRCCLEKAADMNKGIATLVNSSREGNLSHFIG